MTTSDPDLLIAVPAIEAAQAACAATDISSASLSDLQALSGALRAAMAALALVMTAKQSSTASNDVAIYLYAAGLWGVMGSAVATLGTFTGAAVVATVNPNGANAYQLAVRYTGDINNADAIMQANGITDPFAVGAGPIVIPSSLLSTSSS